MLTRGLGREEPGGQALQKSREFSGYAGGRNSTSCRPTLKAEQAPVWGVQG